MSQFIKEFGVVNEVVTNEIINYVQKDPGEFTQSLLYMSSSGEKLVDTEKRNSIFKTITDKVLFDVVDKLIDSINKKDKFFDYSLVRNDITFIKYETGGFFNSHSDYLSYKSNMIEEYTLILCADADCEGGETVFEVNDFFKYKSVMTKTPKNCIIFRKDLNHAGEIITKGYKHIITANLLAVAKSSDNILVISFPDTDKKYILSCDQVRFLGNTFLLGILTFNRTEQKVNYYEETTIPIEAFEIIYKIFTRSYITFEEFKSAKECIDYYCIEYKKILISPYNGKKTAFVRNGELNFNKNIIICTTKEETNYYHTITKELGYSYEPFKVIFVEGRTIPGGGLQGEPEIDYKMAPVFMSLTENDNILFADKLWKTEEKKFNYENTDDEIDTFFNIPEKILQKHPDKDIIVIDGDDETSDDDQDDKKIINNDDSSSDESSDKFQDDKKIINNDESTSDESSDKFQDGKKIINNDESSDEFQDGKKINIEADGYKIIIATDLIKIYLWDDFWWSYNRELIVYNFKYCLQKIDLCVLINHLTDRDEANLPIKTPPINKNFKPQIYNSVIKTMKKIKFFDYIKNKLNSTNFVMPQVKEVVDEFFCNESIYGNLTFIMVTGLLKINRKNNKD